MFRGKPFSQVFTVHRSTQCLIHKITSCEGTQTVGVDATGTLNSALHKDIWSAELFSTSSNIICIWWVEYLILFWRQWLIMVSEHSSQVCHTAERGWCLSSVLIPLGNLVIRTYAPPPLLLLHGMSKRQHTGRCKQQISLVLPWGQPCPSMAENWPRKFSLPLLCSV